MDRLLSSRASSGQFCGNKGFEAWSVAPPGGRDDYQSISHQPQPPFSLMPSLLQVTNWPVPS